MVHLFKEFGLFLRDIWEKRGLVWSLAKNDFRAKNAGSFLGVAWSFIVPTVSILVFWFVFTVLKSADVDNFQFIQWFIPAYVPWMFFTECCSNSVGVLYQYSYLVKKVKFRTSLLPIVKVVASLIINLFFIAVMFIVLLAYQTPLTAYAFQLFYYMAAVMIFCTGLSWLLASVAVFFKDLSSVIAVVLQLGFWVTPIFWNFASAPLRWMQVIAWLNPMFYITQGFRDSVLYNVGFWEKPAETLYFWCFTAVLFIGGALVYRKLRPHFADVL